MIRPISFRAKRSYDKVWIYGFLLNVDGTFHLIQKDDMCEDGHHISQQSDRPTWVDEDTIGQFTGLVDIKGKDIYEGDIVSFYDCYTDIKLNGIIVFREDCCYFAVKYSGYDEPLTSGGHFEVIGNIYDNRDLKID